ncbi:hypothetical protein Tco_0445793 [Tanacetum coccineum]
MENPKVQYSSFLSSEPTISYFNDFDYFKDFEKEFLAIAYNDALTSKLDFSEPTVSPQHIDEFDKTSLSEYDGKEQNVIYFNDLFPFNTVYTAYPNPMDMPYPNPMDTMYRYGVSWGIDMAYRLPVQF